MVSFVSMTFRGKLFGKEEKEDVKQFAYGLYIPSIPAGMEEIGDTVSMSIISFSRMILK